MILRDIILPSVILGVSLLVAFSLFKTERSENDGGGEE
jgi:ABC-type spermidine/putrescine transport system permease subunit II